MSDHSQNFEVSAASWWQVPLAWVGNGVAYLLGGMSPLQAILVAATIVFTCMQGYVLWRDKIARKGES